MFEKEDLVTAVQEIHRLKGYKPKATTAAENGNREPPAPDPLSQVAPYQRRVLD